MLKALNPIILELPHKGTYVRACHLEESRAVPTKISEEAEPQMLLHLHTIVASMFFSINFHILPVYTLKPLCRPITVAVVPKICHHLLFPKQLLNS